MPELVSVAGGGDLGVELDLTHLTIDINAYLSSYEPETHPALKLRLTDSEPTIMLFSSGKYNIHGSSSVENLRRVGDQLVEEIKNVTGFDLPPSASEVDVRNLVFVDSINSGINLEALVEALGTKHAQYEPEVFGSVDYRPPDHQGLFKIFASGKISLTGVRTTEGVAEAFDEIKARVEQSTI
ncbi:MULTISPECIES: hypothetical protein [Halorussus]|uniref:hypothetical protein n=1 Tax=Halorussus TaxID=1070314 RepID=UPI00209FD57C|nr:hypothetical protein [Halorussus vallis]USZ74058.1 hypothetical protein NGM07_11385 [Halorussus vallis]